MEKRGLFGFVLLGFVLSAILVSLSVVSVSAFLVDECPQELDGAACGVVRADGKIHEGICYVGQCIDFMKVQIGLDPAYVAKSVKSISDGGRGFDPRADGIDPFEDIVCDVHIKIPPGKRGEAVLQGRLETEDENGNDIVLQTGSFHLADSYNGKIDALGYLSEVDVYRWKDGLEGYDGGSFKGIASGDKLDEVVKSGKLRCELIGSYGIALDSPKAVGEMEEVSKCTRLWGPDRLYGLPKYVSDYAITSMRGSSSRFNAKEIVRRGKRDMIEGYQEVDPFGSDEPVIGLKEPSYKELFKYYVDLQNYNDGDWEVVDRHFGRKAFSFVSRNSNCPTARIHNFYNLRGMKGNNKGYALFGTSNAVFMHAYTSPKHPVHETGHALAALVDEYVVLDSFPSFLNFLVTGKNCRGSPSFGKYGDNVPGCTVKNKNYRPSKVSIMVSIMNSDKFSASQFNTISCAYILRTIEHTKSFENLFNECHDNLDTIIPGQECEYSDNFNSYPGGSIGTSCSKDNSFGCGTCSSIGECDYTANNGNECVFEGDAGTYSYGFCLDGTCNLQPDWVCSDRFGYSCPRNEKCDETTHKCVPDSSSN